MVQSWAILALAGLASASQWTVTSYFVASQSEEVYTDTYFETTDTYTYTYQDIYTLKSGVTAAASAATSTSTYTDDYQDLEIIEIYIDPAAVDEDDYATITYDDSDDYNDSYTDYVMPLVMTAPESCPTPFTFSTQTIVAIPTEIASQYSQFQSVKTTISTVLDDYYETAYEYTMITAYLSANALTLSGEAVTDHYYYRYYVAECSNPTDDSYWYDDPTETESEDPFSTNSPSGDDNDDDEEVTAGRFGIEQCSHLMACGWLTTALVIIAAILPAIFLLGFLESYFWFRRLMTGRSALRFGTVCWIFLLLPVLCLTKKTPARDADMQAAFKQTWKETSFGTALRLWMKYGFRHRYPTELLGEHPEYKSMADSIAPSVAPRMSMSEVSAQQPIGYGPPPAGGPGVSQPPAIYYVAGANGKGHAGPTQVAPMPPQGSVPRSHPRYPQPAAHAPAPAPAQAHAQPDTNVSTPSPVSQNATAARDSTGPPQLDVSPNQEPISPVVPPAEPSNPPPPPPPAGSSEAGPSGTK